MNKEIITSKIMDYLKVNGKVSVSELYIRFHMMNKGKYYEDLNEEEIIAQDIVLSLNEMLEKGIIKSEYVDNEKLYYIWCGYCIWILINNKYFENIEI